MNSSAQQATNGATVSVTRSPDGYTLNVHLLHDDLETQTRVQLGLSEDCVSAEYEGPDWEVGLSGGWSAWVDLDSDQRAIVTRDGLAVDGIVWDLLDPNEINDLQDALGEAIGMYLTEHDGGPDDYALPFADHDDIPF